MQENLSEILTNDYYGKIASATQMAFSDYLEVENNILSKGIAVDFKPRTKGSFIHDLIVVRIKEQFEGCDDVKIGEFNGIFGILIEGTAFIRFKKITSNFSTSNVQTIQTVRYNNQIELEGFPKSPVKLYVGYLPNATWTAIDNIYLFYREGENILWSTDLTNQIQTQSTMFDDNNEVPDVNIKMKPNKDLTKKGA